jgi:maltose alpha-D-glucosyltransferase/alpha-amylase
MLFDSQKEPLFRKDPMFNFFKDKPPWYLNAIFYEIYLRSFKDGNGDGIGDLAGLTQKLDYLQELGVDCLWLCPIYPSPLKDNGYDISDFYTIDPVYGSLDEFKDLVQEVQKRGMRLIMDLVVNHTSDEHPWFQTARSNPDSPYRDYYLWSDTDELYSDARIIFLDTEKSNWTWDQEAGQYYWHRFYSSQPDLNYTNPAVRSEMLNIVRFWLDMGIDGFRVDAVPYLFEEDGTNCENLPQTHEFLKYLREFVDRNYDDKVLICEANQLPEDVVDYLGDGDEFHIAFHFPLMPKIFMGLRAHNRSLIEETLKKTPDIPQGTQWGTFLRNHDELTLEMVTPEEREWMWREYAPEARMRLNLGIRRRLAPLLDNDPRKIMLANRVLFSLPGTPFLYYGDEIGMGDNIELPDRNGLRTPMQWDTTPNAGFSESPETWLPVIVHEPYSPAQVNVEQQLQQPASLWHQMQELITLRKNEKVFQSNRIKFIEQPDERVMLFLRSMDKDEILFVHNLSEEEIDFSVNFPRKPFKKLIDLFTNDDFELSGRTLSIKLKPYQSLYLKVTK